MTTSTAHAVPRAEMLGIQFAIPTPEAATELILARKSSGYVCMANVHVTMESRDHPDFAAVLAGAWMVLPDGKPVAFTLRKLGYDAHQVRGPSLAYDLCRVAAERGIPIGLYGSRPEVIAGLRLQLEAKYPGLRIVYAYSPPFRSLTETEHTTTVDDIIDSGAQFLLVGLGCPNQERWMALYSAEIPIPLIGVGAWFDFASGMVDEAPVWVRRIGCEWLHRLSQEPRRLWRRYAIHNPRFVALAVYALLRKALGRPKDVPTSP